MHDLSLKDDQQGKKAYTDREKKQKAKKGERDTNKGERGRKKVGLLIDPDFEIQVHSYNFD